MAKKVLNLSGRKTGELRRPLVTPGFGNRFGDWLRVLRLAETPLSARYLPRALAVAAVSLLTGPFRYHEARCLRQRLANTRLHPAPVFIIGHWRSGTTFLHQLLCLDPQFGYVSTVQSLFPHAFLCNRFIPWLARALMPATRPMDDMPLAPDSPQEDEMALVNYGPLSMYHGWHFPRDLRRLYRRLVHFEGMSPQEKQAWQDGYLQLLRVATLRSDGRRLLLKNPAHTGRLPFLRALFPDARFIFLHRDPLEVFPSTRKLYRKVLPYFQLQDYPVDQVQEDIIWIYRDLLTTYLRDREGLPPDRCQEVMFPDLARDPLGVAEGLYASLDLGDFDKVRPRMEGLVENRKGKAYRPTQYQLGDALRKRLRDEWAFAWEAWG